MTHKTIAQFKRKSCIKSKQEPAQHLYLGIDVAKKIHWIALLTDTGVERKAVSFDSTRRGFEHVLSIITTWCREFSCTNVTIGLEPTANYWKALWRYLEDRGYTITLVPSVAVNRCKDKYDNSPGKNDKKDSLLIARLLREEVTLDYRSGRESEEKKEETQAIQAVKDLLHFKEDIDTTITAFANRLESITSEYMPEIDQVFADPVSPTSLAVLAEYPFPADMASADPEVITKIAWKASRGQKGREWVDHMQEVASESIGVPDPSEQVRWITSSILKLLHQLKTMSQEAEKELATQVAGIEQCRYLMSVPGIGMMGAAALTAALGDMTEYASTAQGMKKLGLNVTSCSSGKHRGKDHISKRGMSLSRKIMFMGALSQCMPGSYWYDVYRRLVSHVSDRMKRKAVVGLMRKIVRVAFAVVRERRLFEKVFEPPVCGGMRLSSGG